MQDLAMDGWMVSDVLYKVSLDTIMHIRNLPTETGIIKRSGLNDAPLPPAAAESPPEIELLLGFVPLNG